MKKKFLKLGYSYCALDYDVKQVIICVDVPSGIPATEELSIKIWKGKDAIDSVESMVKMEEIDEATFQEKYSDVVSRLHNETPYA